MKLKKILVPIDFSSNSDAALRYASDLASTLGATLTLIHVYRVSDVWLALTEMANSARDALAKEIVTQAQRILLACKQEAMELGVASVQTLIEEGDAVTKIVRVASDGGFDMIVLGTHGRSGLKRAVLGSVAEGVVRGAGCPVLTIRETPSQLLRLGSPQLAETLRKQHDDLESSFQTMLEAAHSGRFDDCDALWSKFEGALLDHMGFEERILLPDYRKTGPKEASDADAIVSEHEAIRSRLATMGVELQLHRVLPSGVDAFVATLRRHARRENELFYPWLAQRERAPALATSEAPQVAS